MCSVFVSPGNDSCGGIISGIPCAKVALVQPLGRRNQPCLAGSREEGSAVSRTPQTVESENFFRYTCAESSVGRILVVMTDGGVVDIIRGDSRKELLSAALARHPGAGLIPDRGVHSQWVAAIVKRIEKPGSEYGIPVNDSPDCSRSAAS
jgi:hypothetical protein